MSPILGVSVLESSFIAKRVCAKLYAKCCNWNNARPERVKVATYQGAVGEAGRS